MTARKNAGEGDSNKLYQTHEGFISCAYCSIFTWLARENFIIHKANSNKETHLSHHEDLISCLVFNICMTSEKNFIISNSNSTKETHHDLSRCAAICFFIRVGSSLEEEKVRHELDSRARNLV